MRGGNTLDKIQSFAYLTDDSNLKDVTKTIHTIRLLQDYLNYRREQEYTCSYNTLIHLRFLEIDYDIIEIDTSKPILSEYVIERSNMTKRVSNKIYAFEKWVDEQ